MVAQNHAVNTGEVMEVDVPMVDLRHAVSMVAVGVLTEGLHHVASMEVVQVVDLEAMVDRHHLQKQIIMVADVAMAAHHHVVSMVEDLEAIMDRLHLQKRTIKLQ
jgi:SMC interacting uncharacterized protein involved in chromosome segregation